MGLAVRLGEFHGIFVAPPERRTADDVAIEGLRPGKEHVGPEEPAQRVPPIAPIPGVGRIPGVDERHQFVPDEAEELGGSTACDGRPEHPSRGYPTRAVPVLDEHLSQVARPDDRRLHDARRARISDPDRDEPRRIAHHHQAQLVGIGDEAAMDVGHVDHGEPGRFAGDHRREEDPDLERIAHLFRHQAVGDDRRNLDLQLGGSGRRHRHHQDEGGEQAVCFHGHVSESGNCRPDAGVARPKW